MLAGKIHTIYVIDHEARYFERFRKTFSQQAQMVYYCVSEKEAQAIMDGVAPHVVIFRTEPGDETGTAFLSQLQERWPSALRLVYSKELSPLQLAKMVLSGLAHRAISLVWDEAFIARILQRDLLTRSRLQTSKCADFFKNFVQVPVMPTVFLEVQEELRHPNCSSKRMTALIEKDPVIASRLLQVVNSAAMTRNRSIQELEHAVTFFGVEQIRELVLFLCGLQLFPPYEECLEDAVAMSTHSLLCSHLAAEVASVVAPEQGPRAATAGLLHDVGKLVFYAIGCRKIRQAESFRQAFLMSSSEFERGVFGVSHDQVGSFLLMQWHLPMELIECTANHGLPLSHLWGVPLAVAIADRCLIEACSQGEIVTDLAGLPARYPLNKWQGLAREMAHVANRYPRFDQTF